MITTLTEIVENAERFSQSFENTARIYKLTVLSNKGHKQNIGSQLFKVYSDLILDILLIQVFSFVFSFKIIERQYINNELYLLLMRLTFDKITSIKYV